MKRLTHFRQKDVWRCAGRSGLRRQMPRKERSQRMAIVVVEGIQGVKLIVRNGEETKIMMAAVMGTFLVIILIIVMVVLIFLCEDRKTGAGTCN